MKKLAIIGCMAALGVFAEVPEGWSGTTHDLSAGALTAANGGAYWVTGSGNVITVPANVTCTVALDAVTINAPAGANPFTVGAGSTVHLQLSGSSTLTGADGWSGLALSANGASLVVDGDLTGTLTAKGGKARPGICVPDGASFTLDAANATVKATGGAKAKTANDTGSTSAAGLGSYGRLDSGTVTVNAGRLEAKGGGQGAGIGVGSIDGVDGATCGDVLVNGGTVIAGPASWGCGIGGATPYHKAGGNLKSYTQTGGTVTAFGMNCAGIGGGSGGGADVSTGNWGGYVKGRIHITGGRLYATSTNDAPIVSAAIGGGGARHKTNKNPDSTSGGEILIEGGTVIALGDKIGIGAGGMTTDAPTATRGGNTTVTIRNGTVYAEGKTCAIGGPEQATSAVTNLASVTITGGYLMTRGGGVQVQATNGEALGNRPVYSMSCYDSDKSPFHVSGAGDAPAYEYPVEQRVGGVPAGWSWWMYVWLPEGEHRLYDQYDTLLHSDVSPVREVVHDYATIGIMRLTSASSNAVVTGTWNVLDTADKKDNYVHATGDHLTFLTLRNLTAAPSNRVIDVVGRANLTLRLEGENTLRTLSGAQNNSHATITVAPSAALTIEGPGTLTARANQYSAAIGGCGTASCGAITINGGTIYAYGGMQGAGIGCGLRGDTAGTCGPITVNGGTVRAYGFHFNADGTVNNNSGWAAGIGGGTGHICNGGNLTSYTQTGGDVEAYGDTAAGIGGGGGGRGKDGLNGGWCGPVKITGGRLVADSLTYSANQDYCVGAGIGGAGVRHNKGETKVHGTAGYLASYEQTGGDVTVRGARIGIGSGGENWSCNTNVATAAHDTTVKVSGGTLTVETGMYGVHAIGGMEDAAFENYVQPVPESISLKSVTITGGSVKLGGDIQVAPSNTAGEAVFAAPTKMRYIDRAAPPLDVSFAVTNGLGETAYTYAYAGSGHANDENVYFWLPNGSFKIGASGGDMASGVWTPWSGLWIFFR
ncbi:MAG: hypothetical protein IJ658_09880 [Kiritimatiellae bacterium]|nr:hypothetical protein [Kiritimatiellia bacterium]